MILNFSKENEEIKLPHKEKCETMIPKSKELKNNDMKKDVSRREINVTGDYEIRNLFITTATNEALQGFFKVLFSSKKTIKIFWIFSLIITNGLNAYLIIESILTYLSYDVSTSSKYLTENPTLFPKITICKLDFYFFNFNWLCYA